MSQFISFILIVFLILQPLYPIFAEETSDNTPTAATSEITSPAPAPPSEGVSILEAENTTAQSFSDLNTQSTDSDMANSGDEALMATSQISSTTVAVANNNKTQVDKSAELQGTTGKNIINDNISLSGDITLKTGDAQVKHLSSTVINTNIVGFRFLPVILDLTAPTAAELDLSAATPCNTAETVKIPTILTAENTGSNVNLFNSQSTNQSLTVVNNNSATVTHNINLQANSGNNKAIENIGSTSITTGQASTLLNLFTMANTNLVGNCFFFGVINLFDRFTGDIILPYELEFLAPVRSENFAGQTIVNSGNLLKASTSAQTNNASTIENNDSATIKSNINATAITGENSIEDAVNFGTDLYLKTGQASTKINIIDIINTSIYGSGFLILRINHFGNWQGNLIGPSGISYSGSDYFLFAVDPALFSPTEAATETDNTFKNSGDTVTSNRTGESHNSLSVKNNNTAEITNNINLLANSGGNQAGGFNVSMQTGNASIVANILNFVNTNIIGNNWFFAVINVFDSFLGNIVFPRPDLAVALSANKPSVTAEETFSYTLTYGNLGRYKADNAQLNLNISTELEILSSPSGAAISGNTLSWNLGTIEKNQRGQILLTVKAKDLGYTNRQLTATASIETTTDEPQKNNNSTAFTTNYLKKRPTPANDSTSTASSTSKSGGNNSGGSNIALSVMQSSSINSSKKKVKKVKSIKKLVKKVSKKKAKKIKSEIKSKKTRPLKKMKNFMRNPLKRVKRSFNQLLMVISAKIQQIFAQGSGEFSKTDQQLFV